MLIGVYPFAALDVGTAYGAWRLRQRVFVLEQACLYEDLDGRDTEPDTRHVVLQDDGNVVVGYARVLDDLATDGPVWRIGRVVLDPSARGRGWADHLMSTALQVCIDRPVVLDAQAPLVGWYGTLGFEPDGAEFLEDGIPHVPMRRAGSPGTR
jgi:ElaA protein